MQLFETGPWFGITDPTVHHNLPYTLGAYVRFWQPRYFRQAWLIWKEIQIFKNYFQKNEPLYSDTIRWITCSSVIVSSGRSRHNVNVSQHVTAKLQTSDFVVNLPSIMLSHADQRMGRTALPVTEQKPIRLVRWNCKICRPYSISQKTDFAEDQFREKNYFAKIIFF